MANLERKVVNVSQAAVSTALVTSGTNYQVETPTGNLYLVYIDANSDPVFKKSTDRGKTWGSATQIKACTCTYLAVWADWWSGITATSYIHVAFTDSDADDTFYNYINTADDTLGTERTVYAGSSAASTGGLSITRARGGNLICATCIDAGAEYDTVKSTDLFVNKTSINEVWEGAASDFVVLFPNPDSADTQDVCAIFCDDSGTELSLKKYDDSAGTWSEASIVNTVTVSSWWARGALTYDPVNTQFILAFWNGLDAANADCLCWTINDSGVTAKTNIITDSGDDQYCIRLYVIGSLWYAVYCGKSDGSETATYFLNWYYKTSADAGSTWGSETAFDNNYNNYIIVPNMMAYDSIYIPFTRWTYDASSYPSYLYINIPIPIQPRASYQLGM